MESTCSVMDNTCKYSRRSCQNIVQPGHQYCRIHILEDKNSPYLSCMYESKKTGRRCTVPTSKNSLDRRCNLHSLAVPPYINKSAIDQTMDASTEGLLENLSRYRTDTQTDDATPGPSISAPVGEDQFIKVADSDEELQTEYLGTNLTSAYQYDSDSESVDSEGEDPFKYAEVLTHEEVTRITRDKLIRLQSLYIEQFKYLQHSLYQSRARYLQEKNRLKELSTPYPSIRCNDVQRKDYISLRRYHRRHGVEALLYDKCQERRRKASMSVLEQPGLPSDRTRLKSPKLCSYRPMRCTEPVLPLTKFCLQHIESDHGQVLFKRCGFTADSGIECERPVPSYYNQNRCDYHTNITDLDLSVQESSPGSSLRGTPLPVVQLEMLNLPNRAVPSADHNTAEIKELIVDVEGSITPEGAPQT